MRRRFRFTRNFDFVIRPGLVVAYRAGSEVLIPRAHAAAAERAGAGAFVGEVGA